MSLISIITINLNNATGLEKTINSVITQTFKDIELIIIDGFSSDGSLDIIEKNQHHISRSIIEKDDGIYEAMNKGLECAQGDFVLFLNTGDVFNNPSSLENITTKISDKEELYFGKARNTYKNATCYYTPNNLINVDNYEEWLLNNTPCHQATLFPKIYYSKIRYNLNYQIASDVDFKRIAIRKLKCIYIDSLFVDFELGGFSTVPKSLKIINQIIRELNSIDKKNNENQRIKKSMNRVIKLYTKYILYRVLGESKYFEIIGKLLI